MENTKILSNFNPKEGDYNREVNHTKRVSFSENTKTTCAGDKNAVWYYLKVMKVVFGRISGVDCLPLEKVINHVPIELRYNVLSLVSDLVDRYKIANAKNYKNMINRKVIVGYKKSKGILKEINGHTSPQRARVYFGRNIGERWVRLSIVTPYIFIPLRPQGSYDNIILNGSKFNKNIINQCDKYIYKFISKTCIVIQTCYRGFRERNNYSKMKDNV